jgi:hypothetical protein
MVTVSISLGLPVPGKDIKEHSHSGRSVLAPAAILSLHHHTLPAIVCKGSEEP